MTPDYSLVSIFKDLVFLFLICIIRRFRKNFGIRFRFLLALLLQFLALRRLDPKLDIENRLPGKSSIARGLLWWYCLRTLCEHPWAMAMELETKARGEF